MPAPAREGESVALHHEMKRESIGRRGEATDAT